jgi:hypothetical protein
VAEREGFELFDLSAHELTVFLAVLSRFANDGIPLLFVIVRQFPY